MLFRKSMLSFAAALALGGCDITDVTQVRTYNSDGYALHTTTAAVRSYVVRNGPDTKTICMEPAPDVAVDEDQGFAIDFSFLNFGDRTQDAEESGVAEAGLGGRSTNVLVTREMFFRLCEFFANTNLTDQEKKDMFDKMVDTVARVNSQNLGTGTENKAGVDTILSNAAQPSSAPAAAQSSSESKESD